MARIEKKLPTLLDDNSKYIVRVRSINNLGVNSDWSSAIVANTETTASVVGGRLVITDDSIYGYDGNGKLTFGYFGEGVSRANLCINPSFETNITGYTAYPNTTLVSEAAHGYFGTKSLKLTASAAASDTGFQQPSSHRFDVTEYEIYTGSIYIKNPLLQPTLQVLLGFEFFNVSDTSLGIFWSPQITEIDAVGEWLRAALIGITAPERATEAGLHFKIDNTVSINTIFYLYAILIEETDILKEYFDGSNADPKAEWVGTAHASISNMITGIGDVFISGTLTIGEVNDAIDTAVDAALDAALVGYIPIDGASVNGTTTISGDMIRTGAIVSNNFTAGTLPFTGTGMVISLNGGSISAPQFALEADGDAFFKGAITGGTIAIGANFNVTNTGVLTASGANITGAITATSGSFIGSITSTSGTIGGFTIGATSLTATDIAISSTGKSVLLGTAGSSTAYVGLDADIGIWAGHATFASAEFRVTQAGALTATNATITGAVTATSGSFTGAITATSGTIGGFTINSTNLSGGTISGGSIHIGGNDATSFHVDTTGQMWVGAGNTNFATAPFRIYSDGMLRMGSATEYIEIDPTGFLGFPTINIIGGTARYLSSGPTNIDSGTNMTLRSLSGDMTFNADANMHLQAVGNQINIGGNGVAIGVTSTAGVNNSLLITRNTTADSWTDRQLILRSGSVGTSARTGISFWSDNVAANITVVGTNNNMHFRDSGNNYITLFADEYTNVSSLRFKKDVEELDSGLVLDKLEAIKPIKFKMKNKKHNLRPNERFQEINERWVASGHKPLEATADYLESKEHDCTVDNCNGTATKPCWISKKASLDTFGFSAEQLYKVLPAAVTLDEEEKPLGISTTPIIALTVTALQDLLKKVNDLTERLNAAGL